MAEQFNPPSWAKAARPANVDKNGSDAPRQYVPLVAPPGSCYTVLGHAAQYGNSRRSGRTIRGLIVHVTAGGDLEVDADDFISSMTYEMWRPETVSAHAHIGELGEIGLGVPETGRAWTTGRWNDESLSMEIIGRANWTAAEWRTRPKQIGAVITLLVDWCRRYSIPPVWLDASQFALGASKEGNSPIQGTKRGIVDHLEANKAAILLGGSVSKYSHYDVGPGLREVLFNDILPEVVRRLQPKTGESKMIPLPGGHKRLIDTRWWGADNRLNVGQVYPISRPDWVPANATGILCNVTTVAPLGSGFIDVWGQGQAIPDTSVTNYNTNQNVDGRLCLIPLSGAGFNIRASGGKVHAIVDVQGYTS